MLRFDLQKVLSLFFIVGQFCDSPFSGIQHIHKLRSFLYFLSHLPQHQRIDKTVPYRCRSFWRFPIKTLAKIRLFEPLLYLMHYLRLKPITS